MSSNKVLIIGGGPSGLESARCVAELGGEAILIEKRERLGGTPDRESYAKLTHHWRDASEAMACSPHSQSPVLSSHRSR